MQNLGLILLLSIVIVIISFIGCNLTSGISDYRPVKISHYVADGILFNHKTFEYDSNGNLIKKSYYTAGILVEYQTFEWEEGSSNIDIWDWFF